MENYTPFAYYRKFLEEEIYVELDKYSFNADVSIIETFKGNDGEIYFAGEVIKWDNENHFMEYTEYGEKKTFSLEGEIKDRLSSEIDKTIQYIEIGFEKRLTDPKEIEIFSFFLNRGFSTIKKYKAYSEFPFLEKYFNKIENIITAYSSLNDKLIQPTIINNIYSFNLISEKPTETIDKLYDKLTSQEPPLVSCSKEEFSNAFTGKKVENGISWKIIGKNKSTSKVSLIYFLEELIKNGFLKKSIVNDLNKYIKYIFRDKDGNEFRNIKQSKNTISKKPQSSSIIDDIISSL